jgi:putative ABC transport system substrate-binding protein
MKRGDRLARRRLLVAGTTAVAIPRAAGAQVAGKARRLAVVVRAGQGNDLNEPPLRHWQAWREELRRLGYNEGGNLVIDRWSVEGDAAAIPEQLREVASRKPDVIFSPAQNVVEVLGKTGIAIPVVAILADPVGSGLASSLARPGGRITGVSIDAGLEILAKRFALMKEIVPAASRIACLGLAGIWTGRFGEVMRNAAVLSGMTAIDTPIDVPATEEGYRRAFAAMVRDRADCFYATVSAENLVHRALIADLAIAAKLPGIYAFRENVAAGGLIAYAVDLAEIFRRSAGHIDRILNGADPATLPFEQPTRFELVVNRSTARALGITFPESIFARADEVIE